MVLIPRVIHSQRSGLYVLLVLGAIPILIPFLWMLSSSLKTKEMVGDYPPRLAPYNTHAFIEFDGSQSEVTVISDMPGGSSRVKLADGRMVTIPTASITRTHTLEPQWSNYGKILSPKSRSSDDNFL